MNTNREERFLPQSDKPVGIFDYSSVGAPHVMAKQGGQPSGIAKE